MSRMIDRRCIDTDVDIHGGRCENVSARGVVVAVVVFDAAVVAAVNRRRSGRVRDVQCSAVQFESYLQLQLTYVRHVNFALALHPIVSSTVPYSVQYKYTTSHSLPCSCSVLVRPEHRCPSSHPPTSGLGTSPPFFPHPKLHSPPSPPLPLPPTSSHFSHFLPLPPLPSPPPLFFCAYCGLWQTGPAASDVDSDFPSLLLALSGSLGLGQMPSGNMFLSTKIPHKKN